MRKYLSAFGLFLILFLAVCSQKVYGAGAARGNAGNEEQEITKDQEMEENIDSYLAELDFSEIDSVLSQQESTKNLDFEDLVRRLAG